MTRRASLPRADELFRKTAEVAEETEEAGQRIEPASGPGAKSTNLQVTKELTQLPREESRPRHEEKITFYCTGSELIRLERARLALRSEFGIPSDRGRIVRAALAEVLDDLEARGPNSTLVRRLERE